LTLTELKRTLTVGTRVTLTHHGNYGPGDTLAWGGGTRTLPFTREVAVQQSNAVAFAEPLANDGKSWLYWPKASDITFNDAAGTFVLNGMTFKIGD
jgi:hypothetical protein